MTRTSVLNRTLATFAFAAVAAIVSTAARAEDFSPETPPVLASTSTVTRAEVLADLKIYQESGLAEAERVDAELGYDNAKLRAARDRYAQLRNGQRYAALVAQIAQRLGEQQPQARGV